MLSPTTTAVSIGAFEPFGRGEEQVGIGLGVFDLIAGHDRDARRIDAERGEIDRRRLHPAAGRDRPGNARVGQPGQQFARARQRPDAIGHGAIGARVRRRSRSSRSSPIVDAGFADELVGEQTAAHADLAMNAPDRKLDALAVERILPGEHMLIDAVDQRAVEVEQEDGFDAHRGLP